MHSLDQFCLLQRPPLTLRIHLSCISVTRPATVPHRSFLPLEKRGRSSLLFTTHELNALNARLRDAAHDCLVLTEKVRAISQAGHAQCQVRTEKARAISQEGHIECLAK